VRRYYKLAKKVRVHVVETPPNATQDTIFEAFQASLDELRKDTGVVVKLAVFDHISSKPSVVFPARRMCEFCRSLGIPTLVDAAHVPGTLRERDISVEDLGPTFYAVTFHKWCNALRPTGGLWVNRAEIEER
jgi:isopenicillin-N epimerase